MVTFQQFSVKKLKDSSVASLFQNDITKTLFVILTLNEVKGKNLRASKIHRELLVTFIVNQIMEG